MDVAPVAQLDRASVYGTGGWGSESLQAQYPSAGNTSTYITKTERFPPFQSKAWFWLVFRAGNRPGLGAPLESLIEVATAVETLVGLPDAEDGRLKHLVYGPSRLSKVVPHRFTVGQTVERVRGSLCAGSDRKHPLVRSVVEEKKAGAVLGHRSLGVTAPSVFRLSRQHPIIRRFSIGGCRWEDAASCIVPASHRLRRGASG